MVVLSKFVVSMMLQASRSGVIPVVPKGVRQRDRSVDRQDTAKKDLQNKDGVLEAISEGRLIVPNVPSSLQ